MISQPFLAVKIKAEKACYNAKKPFDLILKYADSKLFIPFSLLTENFILFSINMPFIF